MAANADVEASGKLEVQEAPLALPSGTVFGTLIAEGAEGQPVRFAAADDGVGNTAGSIFVEVNGSCCDGCSGKDGEAKNEEDACAAGDAQLTKRGQVGGVKWCLRPDGAGVTLCIEPGSQPLDRLCLSFGPCLGVHIDGPRGCGVGASCSASGSLCAGLKACCSRFGAACSALLCCCCTKRRGAIAPEMGVSASVEVSGPGCKLTLRKSLFISLVVLLLLAAIFIPILLFVILPTTSTASGLAVRAILPGTAGISGLAVTSTSAGVPLAAYATAEGSVAAGVSAGVGLLLCSTPDCASVSHVRLHTGAAAGVAVAAGANGIPVAAFTAAASGQLRLAVCNNAACATPTLTTLVNADVAAGLSLHVAAAGSVAAEAVAVVLHQRSDNSVLALTMCGNAACTASSTVTLKDRGASATVGFHASLAFAADGLPVVSHYDPAAQAVLLTRCTSPDCSARTTATVAAGAGVGPASVLVAPGAGADSPLGGGYGAAGHPVVLFRGEGGRLHAAACLNPNCSERAVRRVGAGAGLSATVTDNDLLDAFVAADGLPTVAHYHAGLRQLRVSHCTQRSCGAATRVVLRTGFEAGALRVTQAANGTLPVIMVSDLTAGRVLLLSCSTPTCARLRNEPLGANSEAAPAARHPRGHNEPTNEFVRALDAGRRAASALSPEGLPVMAVHEPGRLNVTLTRCLSADCRSLTQTVLAVPRARPTGHVALAVRSNNTAVVALGTSRGLFAVFCRTVDCAPADRHAVLLDGEATVAQYPSVAVQWQHAAGAAGAEAQEGADGWRVVPARDRPVFAYFNSRRGTLRVATCGNDACTRWRVRTTDGHTLEQEVAARRRGEEERDDEQGHEEAARQDRSLPDLDRVAAGVAVGTHAWVAVHPVSGLPSIVHYDQGRGNLRIVNCHDPACAGSTSRTLASDGNVGKFATIAFANSTGLPVVSHFDDATGRAQLLVCQNAACTASSYVSLPSVTDGAEAGLHARLAVHPTTGAPSVVFVQQQHEGNCTVTARLCADAACSSATEAEVQEVTDASLAHATLHVKATGELEFAVMPGAVGDKDPMTGSDEDEDDEDEDDSTLTRRALSVASCSDIACSAVTATALPDRSPTATPRLFDRPAAGVGTVSVAVTSQAGATVSFYLADDGSTVHVQRCSDPTCASPQASELPRSRGTAVSAVTTDSAGDVVALLVQADTASLRVARCGNDGSGCEQVTPASVVPCLRDC